MATIKYRKGVNVQDNPAFAPWYEFGHHPDDPNLVDIQCEQEDVMVHVPKDVATKLIEARNRWVAEVDRILTGS